MSESLYQHQTISLLIAKLEDLEIEYEKKRSALNLTLDLMMEASTAELEPSQLTISGHPSGYTLTPRISEARKLFDRLLEIARASGKPINANKAAKFIIDAGLSRASQANLMHHIQQELRVSDAFEPTSDGDYVIRDEWIDADPSPNVDFRYTSDDSEIDEDSTEEECKK